MGIVDAGAEAMEERPPIEPGTVIAGKYRVERLLGMGGMGIVVAAQHMQLHQLVAIKLVRHGSLDSAVAVERFIREARAAVRLRSEHVARVLDVGTLESGAPFMVMEYLEGCDLGEILTRQAPLPVETVAGYVVQACEGLAEAHALGIVHRDLKPQNLFLTKAIDREPLVKVLDFGVSKVTSARGTRGLTLTAAIMGSPLYMAPEQMRSARSATPRSDIWALGVVMYELLTAHLPFEAESIPELCLKVMDEHPVPLRSRRSDVPVALEAIVLRCLEKDPGLRFEDAGALATALAPFAPESARAVAQRARLIATGLRPTEDVSAPVPTRMAAIAPTDGGVASTPHPVAPRRRSKRTLVLAGGFALVVGLGAGVAAMRRPSHDEHERAKGSATLESANVVQEAKGAIDASLPPPPASPSADTTTAKTSAPLPRTTSAPPRRAPPRRASPEDDIPSLR